MPVKTLPIVSNPTQLNEFLVQSLDNTNGGGINKFTTWSGRPTNLNANDQGKTFIFERTGNFHQWTGTVWKVLNTNNTINVEDFGAIGDGVTDCTASVNSAISFITQNSTGNGSTLNFGTIKFPRGIYLLNLDLGSKKINIAGEGFGATVLKPFTTSLPVIAIGVNATWDIMFIENLTISGKIEDTVTDLGIQFGHTPYQASDQYAGRVRVNGVKFINLNKCVNRLYGNIGIYISNCSFFNANYHIWTKGYLDPNPADSMSSGSIIVTNTHLQSAKLASIYINSGVSGDGQFILKDNIFEANSGFVIFVDTFKETAIVPEITFENCWNENNYNSASVTIDTVVYTPPKFAYLKDCTNISFINTPVGSLELKNTNIFCDRCDIGLLTVIKDSKSLITIDNAILETVKTNEFVRTIKNSIRPAGNYSSYFATYHRDNLSKAYTANIVQSIKFNATYQFTGNIQRNTTPRLNDGTSFDNSEQFLINQNEIFISNVQPQIKADRFYVFTLAYKAITGNPINLSITYGTALVSALVLNSTKWKTMAGVISTFTVSGLPNTVALYLTPSALGGSSTVAFGGYQLLEFTNQQDAMEFLESKTFAS